MITIFRKKLKFKNLKIGISFKLVDINFKRKYKTSWATTAQRNKTANT